MLPQVLYMTLDNNTFTRGSIIVDANRDRHYNKNEMNSHNITRSNLVNGAPLLYLANESNTVVTGTWGQVIFANCSDIILKDTQFMDSGNSITVSHSRRITLDNCKFVSTKTNAILIMGSINVTISDCVFRDCRLAGYFLSNDGVELLRNEISNSSSSGFDSDGNKNFLIRCNHFDQNKAYCFRIYSATYWEISYNTYENNKGYAIYFLGNTWHIRVHHNNFIDDSCSNYRTEAVYHDGSEGNYWSDYESRYPNADNDGITWDTPYDTGSGRLDSHPLVNLVDTTAPTLPPLDDIAGNTSFLVEFDGTDVSDDVGLDNVTWSFTYNSKKKGLIGNVTSFLFEKPGTYEIVLQANDTSGNWNSSNFRVYIHDTSDPIAHAGVDVTIDQGASLILNASLSSDNDRIVSYQWSFVYNNSTIDLDGIIVQWTFEIPGYYKIILNVTDSIGHWAIDTINITVRDTESPKAIGGGDRVINQGTNLTLDGRPSYDNIGIIEYIWTFVYDSKSISLIGSVVHFVFEIPGQYPVTLSVSDNEGNTDSTTLIVTVIDTENPIPRADVLIKINSGDTVHFDASRSTDNVGIVGWNWSFDYIGEEVVLTGPTPDFLFEFPGIYSISLQVIDGAGNTGTLDVTVSVRDVNAPIAHAGNDIIIDQGTTISLDGSASTDAGGVVTWEWSFEYGGELLNLEGETVELTFEIPGTYTISLLVIDGDGLTDVDVVQVTVRDTEPPVADAGPDVEVGEGEAIELDGSASTDNVGIVSWTWTISTGDGTIVDTKEGATASTTLPPGTYNVTLEVGDTAGNGAVDQLTVFVRVAGAPVADAGPDLEAREDVPFNLSGSRSTDDVGIVSYVWTYKDDINMALPVTTKGEVVEIVLYEPGVYVITLEVTDGDGLTDTDNLTVTVPDEKPPFVNAPYSYEIEVGDFEIFDGSLAGDNVGVVNWTWKVTFENEITFLYGMEVRYDFDRKGDYLVELTVRDAAGNEDTGEFTVTAVDSLEDEGLPLLWIIIATALIGAVVIAVILIQVLKGSGRPPEG